MKKRLLVLLVVLLFRPVLQPVRTKHLSCATVTKAVTLAKVC